MYRVFMNANPVTDKAGVTVITPSGLYSDVFSTAIFIGGKPMANRLLSWEPRSSILTAYITLDNQPSLKTVNWKWHRLLKE